MYLPKLVSGTLLDYVTNTAKYGYINYGYTSGYIPPDAPPGATAASSIQIVRGIRDIIVWDDSIFSKKKLFINGVWSDWY